ncbi:hypothetical protein [Micromonospora endolithica]|uniref:CBM2 domain-containing protein n=1 Tax=Micromonospora endolithica TaxID=230091 RepID=A0A3A9ZQZ1_9ACTN|nr:hypothetical protein [Micromonospora endolithica]RKN50615.1 hypothetical protein D7223_02255 [Micromonospora endolithica]TWJ20661.1 hypothetical protein JD76_00760 [Micromonospora endolithica]
MAVQPTGDPGDRAVSRALASAPWVVVLLGVALLVGFLLVALLSFRGSERQAAPPPAPPLLLPTLVTTPGPTTGPTDRPTPSRPAAASSTRRVDPPSPSAPRSPAPRATTGAPGDAAPAGVTARYRVQDDDRWSFEVELLVRNDADRPQEWRVEFYFSGDLRGLQASAESGISVSADGTGSYVLRGSRPLDGGDSEVVSVRVNRYGTWDRPDSCTVNGADCTIG